MHVRSFAASSGMLQIAFLYASCLYSRALVTHPLSDEIPDSYHLPGLLTIKRPT